MRQAEWAEVASGVVMREEVAVEREIVAAAERAVESEERWAEVEDGTKASDLLASRDSRSRRPARNCAGLAT